MGLFKERALPVVVRDISDSLQRASRNATTAIACIHDFVRFDPPKLRLEDVTARFAHDVFRLREECYPPDDLMRVIEAAGVDHVELARDCVYWRFYAYLFWLLPLLVRSTGVNGSHWKADEYRQLEATCLSYWRDCQGTKLDAAILTGYERMESECKAWFLRESKVAAALVACKSLTVYSIVAAHMSHDSSLRAMGFASAVQGLVEALHSSFRTDLARYYVDARALGFFAADSTPLSSFIDQNAD